jgi:hypothetical protein
MRRDAADERVVSDLAPQRILARTTFDEVVAGAAFDEFVALAAAQDVVSPEAANRMSTKSHRERPEILDTNLRCYGPSDEVSKRARSTA